MIDGAVIAFDFMSDFNGPSRQFPNKLYPSGVHDEDKNVYKYGPESSEYPNLTLPCNLYDETGNTIQQGYYMAVLSDDKKFINLYQSNNLKARVKVIKLIEKMYTQEELDEEREIKHRMYKYKDKKLKKYRKAEEDLEAFFQRREAENYAEIEDSKKGYYILKYNHNGKHATGIIQK